MQRATSVLLVAILGTSFADAQDQNLTGIERVSLLVDSLDHNASRCGLSDDVIRVAATNAFEEGGVVISNASEPVVALVTVVTTVSENSDRCASDYDISLMARVEVGPPLAAGPVSGLLSLRSEAGAVSSLRSSHSARVSSGLSALARDLATEIRRATEPEASTAAELDAIAPEDNGAYRIARCRELLSSPRLVPTETRQRDLQELRCQELVVAP